MRSRADLHKKYAGYSRPELCYEILQDSLLQKQIRLLVDCSGPLHKEFASHLQAHKAGGAGMLEWHARRAAGHFLRQTVASTLNMISSDQWTERLGLQYSRRVPLDPADASIQEDMQLMQELHSLCVEIAGNRAWSQLFYSNLFPHVAAQVFLRDSGEREMASEHMRRTAGRRLWGIGKFTESHNLASISPIKIQLFALCRQALRAGGPAGGHDLDSLTSS